jgi:hypothetical protein
MSTFYLLPSRPQVGERFAGYLSALFPGLQWPKDAWSELAESLTALAAEQPDVFIVYRDELPSSEETLTALADGYGAAAGDAIIEVQPGGAVIRRDVSAAA